MSLLFSPLTLREITLSNRIVVSPMCQYSAKDGVPNDWHMVHLGSRAVGGAGLVFTEATAVCPEGRISPFDLGLWNEEQVAAFSRITTFIAQTGSVPGIQLAHAGRKASVSQPWKGDHPVSFADGGWQSVGPGSMPFGTGYPEPVALEIEDISHVAGYFAMAAQRALRAGFKVLEIHGAHGYLIHQFLSPICNKRTDHYGGSFDNRIRFLLQIIEAVREVWPRSLPLFLRISASDWNQEGWQVSDSVALASIVKDKGTDLIDCSSGGIAPGITIPAGPGYQVPFSAAVKRAGIPTGAVGIIVTAQQAEQILEKEEADLIFMARELLRDPYFPMHAAGELGIVDMPWPVQYERAKRKK